MPIWIFQLHPALVALIVIGGILFISMASLFLFRRYIMPRIEVHDGVNDAISGTVQAIGVFYGVTVGLLAVGVWNTWSTDSDLVAKEAAAIKTVYRDAEFMPEPTRSELRQELRAYIDRIIEVEWPAQRRGEAVPIADMGAFHATLMVFVPANGGEQARYAELLAAYNRMLAQRALRIDAVNSGLSQLMWYVIWGGAAISIGVAYFFHLEDWRLHAALVALMAGFLGLVLFMIVMNDRPFLGQVAIGADSYELIRDRDMGGKKP